VVEVKVDGHQAVEAVKNDDYDVVLMDCQLPGIDGYEATRRIRELESSGGLTGERPGRLPIVALTASATVEDLQRARLAGMDGHIAKPVDARRLLVSVAQHVDAERTPFLDPSEARSSDPAADAPRSGAVVDLHRALERLQGNQELLERMIVQFHEEAGAARGRLREGLARRDKGGLHYAAHRLRGQALSLDAEALVSALAVLEGAVAGEEWSASAEALARVEQEIDRLRDVLLHA
jgi:CheY-like chemotaxis protein/HPt (histidine-containing phosphotransfer) domain-containing protein